MTNAFVVFSEHLLVPSLNPTGYWENVFWWALGVRIQVPEIDALRVVFKARGNEESPSQCNSVSRPTHNYYFFNPRG